MNGSDHLIELLVKASMRPELRGDSIRDFQRLVWDNPDEIKDERMLEVFGDLALDLDYYESDPTKRSEDPSYYGDERLEEQIRAALNKLHALGAAIPFDRLHN